MTSSGSGQGDWIRPSECTTGVTRGGRGVWVSLYIHAHTKVERVDSVLGSTYGVQEVFLPEVESELTIS